MGKVWRRRDVRTNIDTRQLEAPHWASPDFKRGPDAAKVPTPCRLLLGLPAAAAAAAMAPPLDGCNSVAASKLYSTDTAVASLSPVIADRISHLIGVKCSAWGIACCALQQQRQRSGMTCVADK